MRRGGFLRQQHFVIHQTDGSKLSSIVVTERNIQAFKKSAKQQENGKHVNNMEESKRWQRNRERKTMCSCDTDNLRG